MDKKTNRKRRWRALRGKDSNKVYLFKNQDRLKSFKRMDTSLKGIYRLAALAFVLSLSIIIVGLVILVMSYVFIIGFTIAIADNPGLHVMQWAFNFVPWTLIIFVVAYLSKFIAEWIFILRETRDLKKEPDANTNYLAVSRAIRRVKVCGLLVMLILFVALGVISYFFVQDSTDTDTTWTFMLLGLVIPAWIFNKVFSARELYKIQPNVEQIVAERNAGKSQSVQSNNTNVGVDAINNAVNFCRSCGKQSSGGDFCAGCGLKY